MPTSKLLDITSAGERWPLCGGGGMYRSMPWGDMEVGFTQVPMRLDCTNAYKEGVLPGGVCPCPHYGYVFEGKIRCIFPDTDWPDEVAEAGDAYFFPSGHVLIYEEPTKALELNPRYALVQCMDAMQRAMEVRLAAGDQTASDLAAAKVD